MEYEEVDDHFFVFDNVAVFTASSAIDYFPVFSQKMNNASYDFDDGKKIVFAAVTSKNLITMSNFDLLEVHGLAILNMENKVIDFFHVENNAPAIKTRILDVITHNFQDEIFMDIVFNNLNFDVDALFLVKYGFCEPLLIDKVIRLRYIQRPSIKLTLMQIQSVVASLKSDVLIFQMFIPKVVATTLSKCIDELNEAAGNLSIVKYIETNVALMGLNSNNIQSGDEGNVGLPAAYSPFVFHTHPDHITREFKAFISWPSGQDMMLVAQSFINFRDQLVHFVASPEGLWTIHITPEFQKLLVYLRTKNSKKCVESLLDAIHKVFTQFEKPRLAEEVRPINRFAVRQEYLSTTKKYKLSNLFTHVPQLAVDCKYDVQDDAQLFNVSLIKWKRFSETGDEGVSLTFDYISDIPGGLSPFFFSF